MEYSSVQTASARLDTANSVHQLTQALKNFAVEANTEQLRMALMSLTGCIKAKAAHNLTPYANARIGLGTIRDALSGFNKGKKN